MSDPNQTQIASQHDDEIDLRELFGALWRGKFLIMLCVIAAIALAALYLRSAERKYTVRYVFKPVATEDARSKPWWLRGTGLSCRCLASIQFKW